MKELGLVCRVRMKKYRSYQEIYDKNIVIEFIDYTREEKNFNNVENLKNRLNLDTKLIAKIL